MRNYVLRIALDVIEPPIWRRVLVPSDLTLGELHVVIQAAMGWMDAHLHEFHHGKKRYGVQDEEEIDSELRDEDDVRLEQLLKKPGQALAYWYDFGDDWWHTVTLEELRAVTPEERDVMHCLAGARACPPEDCGGPHGYAEFLESLGDPNGDARTWVGPDFDPEVFDLAETDALVTEAFAPAIAYDPEVGFGDEILQMLEDWRDEPSENDDRSLELFEDDPEVFAAVVAYVAKRYDHTPLEATLFHARFQSLAEQLLHTNDDLRVSAERAVAAGTTRTHILDRLVAAIADVPADSRAEAALDATLARFAALAPEAWRQETVDPRTVIDGMLATHRKQKKTSNRRLRKRRPG